MTPEIKSHVLLTRPARHPSTFRVLHPEKMTFYNMSDPVHLLVTRKIVLFVICKASPRTVSDILRS